ncbi:ion transporter [Tenacibaculum sp. IB213877]|uniref:ion transporter n=1 Tax=Tenacibaculum sp. IB213877 TaxID=3097351 RepID=UPI002A5AB448|nr:ion transporter [Tenacibaculum sp. IB213877]MDY0779549.1 ion transporter [Tenacibaculum sp. IB213877]
MKKLETKNRTWREILHEVIYEADTRQGKLFDIILLGMILISILLVMLESINDIDDKYHDQLYIAEWVVTIIFSLEYIVRIISIRRPSKYIFSFYGIIDFLSTIPMYLSMLFVGTHSLVALRALRLLRVFRILKLSRFIGESNQLMVALNASKAKIGVFLYFVLIVCIILGTVMYLIEGADNGFTSIPRSIYWSIVTLTTVGYGDIAPQTALGQFIASITVIIGYAIIAIPTGIVSSEMTKNKVNLNTQSCPNCSYDKHRDDAEYCYHCGTKLN